jgi:serine/threonine protein kinase
MIQNNSGPLPLWMGTNCSNELKECFASGIFDTKRAMKKLKDPREVVGFKSVDELMKNQPELRDLLKQCLENDPKKRISCKQALKHPYF